VVRRILSAIRQYESHRQLIASVRSAAGRPGGGGLDAIVVPASRPASNLESAVTLARAARCLLVVFCSHEARVSDVAQVLADRCFSDAVVVEIPQDYQHDLLRFESTEFARARLADLCVNPNGDLSTKRNLGLLLAQMVGWSRIFFMDDDVRDISPDDLAATVSLLGRFRSAGMRVIDFPDNSVVCHAHRETGADQDVFVSGSALGVRPHLEMGFFPEIYNEDWFFFHGDVRDQRLGWSGRNATQLRYDPFANILRAERQEFGDVLAEGLYALHHLGEEKAAADLDFWEAFLAERHSFLRNIIRRSQRAAPEIQGKMIDAVHTAMGTLKRVEPWMCEEYVQAWSRDLKNWKDGLACLPAQLAVASALEWLGLSLANGQSPARQSSSAQAGVNRNGPSGPTAVPRAPTAGLLRGRSNAGIRGRHRRGRGFVDASRQFLTPTSQPDPVATDIGEEVPWAHASAVTQPMTLGSLGVRLPACDPALELLRARSSPVIADLANAGVCFVPEGQIHEDQKALTSP
jgi:hypothetical protein